LGTLDALGFTALATLALVAPAEGAAQPATTPGDRVGQVSSDIAAGNRSFGPACRQVRKVPVTVTEPFDSILSINDARHTAIRRAGMLAINSVIGFTYAATEERRVEAKNTLVRDFFISTETRKTGGLVKYRLTHENMLARNIDGRSVNLLMLDLEFTVCIPKTADEIRKERQIAAEKARPPRKIDSPRPVFFDPRTGKPRLWFWKAPDGEILLYDKAGFYPETGDALQPVTAEIASEWKKQRARHEAARKRALDSLKKCDVLAANPRDRRKPANVAGTGFGVLRLQARAAISACARAAGLRPNEPRYAYQLGRAWQTRSLAKARPFLERAAKRGYGAAYDNLGWILKRQNRPEAARAIFENGVRLGDPSSMVSLGWIYEEMDTPWSLERAANLYARAAALGDEVAQRSLDEFDARQEERARQAEEQAAIEQQQQIEAAEHARLRRQQNEMATRLFLGVLGAVIQQQRTRH